MDTSGQSIRMTFSKALDETNANEPPATAFTVKGDGIIQTISTLAISGTDVTLTLDSALAGGMTVTVSYTDPTTSDDTSAVQDTGGNDAGSFVDQPVTREKVTLSVDTKTIPLAHTDPDGKTTFTVTRTGPTTSAVTVPVIITQDQDWLSPSRLNQSVTIAAGDSSATLELTSRWFWEDNDAALGSGTLTATLGGVTGYDASGQSQTVYVHGRNQSVGIIALDQTDYRLAEGSGANTIYVVSTLETGLTPTLISDASVIIGTDTEQDPERPRSTGGRDHEPITELGITFSASDYQLERGRYTARKPFTLTIYDDESPEPLEYFRLALQAAPGHSYTAFPLCVGTDCSRRDMDTDPTASVAIVSDDLGAPRNLAATAASGTQINLSWDAPSILGNTAITGYRIEVAESGDSTNWAVLTADTGTNGTSHAHTGLPSGATRHYRVAAIDDSGTGPNSGSASATTTGSPSGPVFTNAYISAQRLHVFLNFSETIQSVTTHLPASSALTVKADGAAATISSMTASGSALLLGLDTAVTEGAAVTVSYADPTAGDDTRAIQDSTGNDAPSFSDQPVAETPSNTGVPGKPTNLSASFDGSELEMTLTWDAPSATGDSAITGYKVESSTDDINWETLSGSNSTTTHVDGTVLHGTTYYYRVSAINDDGTGQPSDVLPVDDEFPPPLPHISIPANGDQVHLTFAERLDSTITAANLANSYTVLANGVDVTSGDGTAVTIDRFIATLTLSTGEKIYKGETVTVSYTDPTPRNDADALQDAAGNDVASLLGVPAGENNSTQVGKPLPPTDLTATGGENQIVLSWTAPKRNGGSPITGYKVDHFTDAGTTWEVLVANSQSAATGNTDTALPVSTTKHYRVSAINQEGTSDPSDIASGTTSATGDTAGPTLVDAEVGKDGTNTVLTFDEELEAASGRTAPLTAFRLTADGTAATLTSVSTDGKKKEVTLEHTGTVIDEEDTVTISYTDPSNSDDAAAVQDVLGNDAPSFPDRKVINNSQVIGPCDPAAAEQLWCATLTVGTGTDSDSNTVLGYHTADSRGTLAPSTFNRSTAIVAVEKVQYTNTVDGNLEFEVKLLSGTAPAEGLLGTVDLALHVDSLTFDIENPGTATSFSFTDHGVAWTEDQQVRVRLTYVRSEPDAPTGLMAEANGATRIDLSWTAPANDGGKSVTGYLIEWSADGNAPWNELVASHDGSTYSDTGLSGGTTRHYKVHAINEVGTGPASQPANATTTTVTVDTTGPVPSRADVPSAGTSVTVQFNEDINQRTTGLPDKEAFKVRVNGAINPITSLTTKAGVTDQLTLNLTNQVYPGQVVTVRYTDPTAGDDAAAVQDSLGNDAASFSNQEVTNGSTVPAPMTIDFTEESYTFSEEGSAHTVTALAKTTVDAAPDYGASVTVRTSVGTPLGQTSGADADDVDMEDQNITFAAGDFSKVGDVYTATRAVTITIHDDGDVEGTEYFKLTLERPSGQNSAVELCTVVDCPLYPEITETDTHTNAPVKVSGVNLTPASRQVQVSWDPADRATGYRVEWRTGSQDYSPERSRQVQGGDTTSTGISGLGRQTTYTVRVFATNSVGDSPASDEKSTTTPTDAAPGQVTGLTVTPWPSYEMDLEWNEPEDSTVTGYSISASYDGEEWESLTLDTGNTRTWYTDKGASVDRVRHYRVRARNSFGHGTWSGAVSAESSFDGSAKPCTREGAVWCGTMTVANLQSGNRGYQEVYGGPNRGDLWPTRFRYKGSDYSVEDLDYSTVYAGSLYLYISRSGNNFNRSFSLWIGDRERSFANGTYVSGSGYYRWQSQGGGPAAGERAWVELVDRPGPQVLTGKFTNVPDEHDGTEFKFQVEFSNNITTSESAFPQAFSVTGGTVKETARVSGGSDLWDITVSPDGTGQVTISLPDNQTCGTGGAPCSETPDGKGRVPLANSPTTTVPGPVLISVGSANGTEGVGNTVSFEVSLSRAPAGTLTVAYTTSDDTAVAGSDYTAVSGTLTFQPGEQSQTITVDLVNDDQAEQDETFDLTLSDPAGGQIDTGTATGIITDDD